VRAADRFVVAIEPLEEGRGASGNNDGGSVVVRVRDREQGAVVRAIPVGTDVEAAEDLRIRIHDDLARFDADTFLRTYAIGAGGRPPARRAYLGLGSNVGDRAGALQAAVDGFAAADGVRVVAVSPVYETAPVGGPEQPEYLNAVVAVDTDRTPRELLEIAKRLKEEAGRVPGERWAPARSTSTSSSSTTPRSTSPTWSCPTPVCTSGRSHGALADLDPMLARGCRPARPGSAAAS
jgi:2-amino-4-hydroxy-6-hydroxymethyldihydropteridine diphosphokinase